MLPAGASAGIESASSSGTAAFAGVLVTLENKNFYTTQGTSWLLTVMAAVFIGAALAAFIEALRLDDSDAIR